MGGAGFITLSIDVFATLTPTNKMLPTGGVIVPIHKLNTSIIPNCIAVIPIKSLVTTGRNIGVNINIAGVISINVPTTKSITLLISKITILLLLIPSKAFEIGRRNTCKR